MKTKKKQKECFIGRIREMISRHCRKILYVAIVLVLWGYLIYNWEKCNSMQFFSQFDGNNILFLVGIAFIVLPFYKFKFEGNGLKIQAEMRDDFQNADFNYIIKLIQKNLSDVNENRKEDN